MLFKLINRGSLLVIGWLMMSQAQADLYKTGLIQLSVSKPGMYRITHEELLAAGVDLNGVKIRKIALTHGKRPMPVDVQGAAVTLEDGQASHSRFFGAGGSIRFMVDTIEESLYADHAVYTLHISGALRQRIVSKRAKPKDNVVSQRHYRATHRFEQQSRYAISASGDDDPWIMSTLVAYGAAKEQSYSFDLDGFAPSQGEVRVSFDVAGSNDVVEAPDHHAALLVNGKQIDAQTFDGFDGVTLSSSIDASELSEQGNTVTVKLPYDLGLPFDVVNLDEYRVEYPRQLSAQDNALMFDSAAKQLQVDGFGGVVTVYQKHANGVVYKLRRTQQLTGNDGAHSVAFSDGEQTDGASSEALEHRYLVVSDEGYLTPQIMALPEPEDIQQGEAEYLVIAHPDFIGDETLARLVQHRQGKYSTKLVNVEQIYAQFGLSVPDPEAIKQYIQFAHENLSTQMVLLVGSDNYDYKHYISEVQSHIPTPYVSMQSNGLLVNFAPSDASYGDLDADGIPEIAIGRLPVRTQAELSQLIDKIEQYENRGNLGGDENYARRSLFVADHTDNGTGYSFVQDADSLISTMPTAWQSQVGESSKAYLEHDGTEQAKTKLIAGINQGMSLVSFLGHSSLFQWSFSKPVLFNAADVASLNNQGKPSVFIQWGCWSNYFVFPDKLSLGQSMLLTEGKGAATVLGASTLTKADNERGMANFLYKELFTVGTTLGQAVVGAKRAYAKVNPAAVDVLLGWQILGDPAIEIELID